MGYADYITLPPADANYTCIIKVKASRGDGLLVSRALIYVMETIIEDHSAYLEDTLSNLDLSGGATTAEDVGALADGLDSLAFLSGSITTTSDDGTDSSTPMS